MREKFCKAMKKLKGQNWTVVALNAMALMVVIQNMNTTCAWLDHQPEVPEDALRYKKS